MRYEDQALHDTTQEAAEWINGGMDRAVAV